MEAPENILPQRASRPHFAPAALALLLTCRAAVAQDAAPPSAADGRPTTRPATSSAAGVVAFQPGVRIEWTNRRVLVDARVVLRAGPLEFFACVAPNRAHESVLLLDASATHVYMALGLIGLTPGHPPRWDEVTGRMLPADGECVDVRVEWTDVAGVARAAAAFEWLREIEYGRAPLPRPWLFCGSVVGRDGRLAADASGAGIALVDFGDSLLTLSRGHADRNADLWAEAHTPAIPPLDTRVVVVLSAARPMALRMRLDVLGELWVNDCCTTPADAADLMLLNRRMGETLPQRIDCASPLRSDEAALRARLAGLGVPAEALRVEAQR
ncbi:MAG: hypothetical protein CHACPFDD_04027 [Phycisphaerae bacterium]|nr:hypothetical protein [Phycisphaerae bacterium]